VGGGLCDQEAPKKLKVLIYKTINEARQWFGHICRRKNEDDIRKDLQSCSINEKDRVRWRTLIDLGLWQSPTTRTGKIGDR